MPQDSPQDSNWDDREKNLFRPLIKLGYDVDEMAIITNYSPATIYRRFHDWKWKRGWIEPDPPPSASPAAAPATAPPTAASASPPTATPGDLLTPEIRAKVEALKKKRRKP